MLNIEFFSPVFGDSTTAVFGVNFQMHPANVYIIIRFGVKYFISIPIPIVHQIQIPIPIPMTPQNNNSNFNHEFLHDVVEKVIDK